MSDPTDAAPADAAPADAAPLDVRFYQWLLASVILAVWALVPWRGYVVWAAWDGERTARATAARCRASHSPICESEAWQAVLTYTPDDVDAHAGLCLATEAVSGQDEALEARCAVAVAVLMRHQPLDPRRWIIEAAREAAFVRRHELFGALRSIERLLSQPGADATRWLTARGEIQVEQGDLAGALDSFQQATRLATSSADAANHARVAVLTGRGQWVAVLDPLGALLREHPGDEALLLRRGLLLLRLGRPADAQADLGVLWGRGRRDAGLVLAMADADLALGHWTNALGYYGFVRASDSGSVAARVGVFHATLMSNGRHLRRHLRDLDGATGDGEVALHLGRALGAYCARKPRQCTPAVRERAQAQYAYFISTMASDPRSAVARQESDALGQPVGGGR